MRIGNKVLNSILSEKLYNVNKNFIQHLSKNYNNINVAEYIVERFKV